MSDREVVLMEVLPEQRIAVLTLNRPESRNAMNMGLVARLHHYLDELEERSEVNAVVLTAADPVFCAGADLKEVGSSDPDTMRRRVEMSTRLYQRFRLSRLPFVAGVNGHALAGGCGLAMSCDLVVASEEAEFGYPEVRRGLVAALVMVNLVRMAKPRLGLEMILTGRRVSAEEAFRAGLVNRVVPKSEVLPEAIRLASEIANCDPAAVRISKDLYYRLLDSSYDAGLEQARFTNLIVRQSKTALERARAFGGNA